MIDGSTRRIAMGIPTLRRYDLLRTAIISALSGTTVPEHVVVIDNGGVIPERIASELSVVGGRANISVQIVQPGRNIGVAASWNLIADLTPWADYLVIANDDTTCYPGTIASLVAAADAQPDMPFFFPASGGYKNAWSFYLQRRDSWESIGPYDEYISPFYGFFEDNDMSYRLQLAGKRHVPVERSAYGHVDSATVKSMSESELRIHWERFAIARQHFINKWGGEPGHERFTIPFNGARPDYQLRMPTKASGSLVVAQIGQGAQDART
jgi:GT2 family glycosyltransferase